MRERVRVMEVLEGTGNLEVVIFSSWEERLIGYKFLS